MNKGIMWAVIGVAVVAGGAYVAFGMGKPASSTEGTASTTPAVSLRELMASAAPQKCTFTSANNTQGTTYIAGGKVRGDFSAEAAGKAVMGHMIVMENTSYVWMDGMSQGFKNSFEATASAESSAQGVDPDERVSYSCVPWSADENQFSLPTGITFAAIGDMQVKAGAGAVGASCSQCAQIPDANAKAQCLAALHC